jgi:3-oxoadipate enol-lactonase
LNRITCPALVICGEDDILKKPKFSQIIADAISGSEYVTIPNCGHVAIFEKTGELCSVILGFIMKHTAS